MSGEERLGAGINLDRAYDFSIDSTGDIQSVSGAEELNKDLAFQLSIALDEFRGKPVTNELKSEIKSVTKNTILSDVRVRSVDSESIQIERSSRDSISVLAPYTSVNGQAELIFKL